LTFKSLYIESHPSRESAHADYVRGVRYEVVCSLNAITFPKSAVVFAKEHSLAVYYVDNAWARVAIDGRLLKQFMAFGAKTEIGLDPHLARIRDDRWYVIEEEEF
jgi:hypothetical protein